MTALRSRGAVAQVRPRSTGGSAARLPTALAAVLLAAALVLSWPARGAGQAPPAAGPNGENPSAAATLVAFFPSTGGRRLLVSRSGRGASIRGRLTDAVGAGIRGAVIDVRLTVMAPWVRPQQRPGARTGPDGSFSLRVPSRRVSRRVRLTYRPALDRPEAVATLSLGLRVRAAVTLRLRPAAVARGGTLRFAGRLLGRPLPRQGKVVELQARDRGAHRWLTFRTLRVRSRRGRFRARHTFRRARGPLRLEFRARARADGAYPFATGASRPVRARVG